MFQISKEDVESGMTDFSGRCWAYQFGIEKWRELANYENYNDEIFIDNLPTEIVKTLQSAVDSWKRNTKNATPEYLYVFTSEGKVSSKLGIMLAFSDVRSNNTAIEKQINWLS